MHKKLKRNEGMALVLGMLFLAVCLVLLSGVALRLVNQSNQVTRFIEYKEAFQGLEAAYAASRAELEDGEDGAVGITDWEQPTGAFPELSFETDDVAPVSMSSMPNVGYFAAAQNWFTDGLDNNGDGVVDDAEERFMFTVFAWARRNATVRQAEVVLHGQDVNVWRNAIFAGSGQAGGLINGNVSIHGSVHLLGEAVGFGTPVLEALDLSGTSLIHNNYAGMPADLRVRIPDLPTMEQYGEQVETLEANLRVKKGLVGLSGNSEIGAIDVSGDGKKDLMDGTFVNDGWIGTAVTPDGDRGDPKSVYSDNGWDEMYDLGDKVPFPVLSDDWRWPDDGRKEWNSAVGDYYTHEEFFNQVLLADESNPSDGVYEGDIDIYTRGKHFYWNATTGEELSGSLPSTFPSANEDYILFDVDKDVLYINGQITIDGSLTVRGKGNQREVHYTGRAAILAYDDVTLDTSLLAVNNGNPNDTTECFPVDNIIGIMSAQDMVVGSTAQIDLMGAFYAQGKIASSKQTNVLGTFVSNYFDMGTNVPSIFQVPTLADNLPLGMIGNYPIMSMSQLSWRELTASL